MARDHFEGTVDRHEFARQMQITPRTAWSWARKGYGPPRRKIGGRVYYVQAEIDRFVADAKHRPPVVA